MDISIPRLKKKEDVFRLSHTGMMSLKTMQGFEIPVLKMWANLKTGQRSTYELLWLCVCASWSMHLSFASMGIKLVLSSWARKFLSIIRSTSQRCFRRVSWGTMGIYQLLYEPSDIWVIRWETAQKLEYNVKCIFKISLYLFALNIG